MVLQGISVLEMSLSQASAVQIAASPVDSISYWLTETPPPALPAAQREPAAVILAEPAIAVGAVAQSGSVPQEFETSPLVWLRRPKEQALLGHAKDKLL